MTDIVSFEQTPSGWPAVAALPAHVPHYLSAHYWWAYVHPNAVKLFERQWLVNLILWGNYRRLRDAALSEFGERLPGRSLQVACVYGDLTCRLTDRVAAAGGTLDVVDVLPIQLENLRSKLAPDAPVIHATFQGYCCATLTPLARPVPSPL